MPSEVLIRTVAEADKDDIAALWKESFGRHEPWNEPGEIIRRKTALKDELFFVGEIDGHVIATLIAG